MPLCSIAPLDSNRWAEVGAQDDAGISRSPIFSLPTLEHARKARGLMHRMFFCCGFGVAEPLQFIGACFLFLLQMKSKLKVRSAVSSAVE
jgi:hypothetical protein